MMTRNPDFEALKDMSRLSWMLSFEALATVANDEDALAFVQRKASVPA